MSKTVTQMFTTIMSDVASFSEKLIQITMDYSPDLYSLYLSWEKFMEENKADSTFGDGCVIYTDIDPEVAKHFKITFLSVLDALRKNKDEPISFNLYPNEVASVRTFDNALRALAFLIRDGIYAFPYWDDRRDWDYKEHQKRVYGKHYSYNLWAYLKAVNSLSYTYPGWSTFKDSNVYQLYKNTLLFLPDNEMYAVYRLDPQGRNILEKYLNSIAEKNPTEHKSESYDKAAKELHRLLIEEKICARQEGYIALESEGLKVAFLWNSPNNVELIQYLNKIPQFIKDENEIKNRKNLKPLLNHLDLLPSELNSIIDDYNEKPVALASSLDTQLDGLRNEYCTSRTWNDIVEFLPLFEAVKKDEILQYNFGPPICLGVTHIAYNLFFYCIKMNKPRKAFEYNTVKALQRFINGISYDGIERPLILNRLKKPYPDKTNPRLDQFISGVLELAGIHSSLIVSKSLLQKECKIFSTLTQNSSMSLRLSAEEKLNALIKNKVGEENSVDFLMPNETDEDEVRLFIKMNALKTLEFLRRCFSNSISIHLSPLYIDKLFTWIVANSDPEICSQDTAVVINFFINQYYHIASKYIRSIEPFHNYGYEIKLNKLADISLLFKERKNEKIVYPAKTKLNDVIMPLAKALEVFTYGKDKHVDNLFYFVATFRQNVSQPKQIGSEEMALEYSMCLLLSESLGVLVTLKSRLNSSFSLRSLFPSEIKLINAIAETQEKMINLMHSIKLLLEESYTGKNRLMLRNL